MKKLRTWMELHDVSQSELARRMDLSQPTIWAWLHGESMPSLENLRRLAAETGIPVQVLIEQDAA